MTELLVSLTSSHKSNNKSLTWVRIMLPTSSVMVSRHLPQQGVSTVCDSCACCLQQITRVVPIYLKVTDELHLTTFTWKAECYCSRNNVMFPNIRHFICKFHNDLPFI